jgi:streptomycin 6-kinase
VTRGRRRCHRLAALSGEAPEAIWQWGFIERVANGLLLKERGLDAGAHESFAVVEAWALALRELDFS